MARVEIDETVLQIRGAYLRAVTGASVRVNFRSGGAAPVYGAETGDTTRTQPLTTATGRIEGWLEAGYAYDLVITLPNGTTYTQPFEAVAATTIGDTPAYTAAEGTRGVEPDTTGLTVGALIYKPCTDGTTELWQVS